MPIITNVQVQQLQISRMVFHVVGHDSDHPRYFKEVNFGQHHGFFLERVKSTIFGPRFRFSADSQTYAKLGAIQEGEDNKDSFLLQSKRLAKSFHDLHRSNKSPGLFMLFKLGCPGLCLYSIIKYNHPEVLRYRENNDSAVVLSQVKNSFVRSKDAIQKSAFINLSGGANELVVIDRQNNLGPAEFYLRFLGIERTVSNDDLTQRLNLIALSLEKNHRNDLPVDVRGTLRRNAYNYVQLNNVFNENEFLTSVCGALPDNSPIRQTYRQLLEEHNLDGEQFELSKRALKNPVSTTYKTRENVRIIVPENAENTIAFSTGPNNEKIITVTTTGLVDNE